MGLRLKLTMNPGDVGMVVVGVTVTETVTAGALSKRQQFRGSKDLARALTAVVMVFVTSTVEATVVVEVN